MLWIEGRGAVVAGYSLVDFGRGLEINPAGTARRVSRSRNGCGR
jgi:hypothetical protein